MSKQVKQAKPAPPARPRTADLWFHPQRGALLSLEDVSPRLWSYRGGRDGMWRPITTVRVEPDFPLRAAAGQRPPAGFLWADPSAQNYGLGGPYSAYGPLERTCRDCGESFTWSARSQKQIYEDGKANSDVVAKRCQPCARVAKKLEAARREYADALRELERVPTAAAHLRVAESVFALVKAGGRASLDRAIGHCRSARKLGARKVDAVEAALRALR